MTLKAIFFDMGGTLQTFWHTRELRLGAIPGLQQLLLSAGLDLKLSDDALLDLVASRWEDYHVWSMGTLEEIPPVRVWREFILRGFPEAARLTEEQAEDLMFYFETRLYQRDMRPEVPEVLQALSKMGIKIGLISNVCGRRQVSENLREYGLLQYFDPIVLSSVYGWRKPDPSIFHYAARLADVPTSDCIYVGDRVNRDIVGAKRAGFRLAIQIEHDFKHGEKDEGAVPDVVIQDMRELLAIVQREVDAPSYRPVEPLARALLFDAGDILYYRPNKDDALNAFLREVVGEVRQISLRDKEALNKRAHSRQITQQQFREETLRLYGVTEEADLARGVKILEQAGNDIAYFEGVRDTLIALKGAGYYLGIITDTAHSVSNKMQWFEQGGFGHVWDAIISSYELGITKPDTRIYQAALRQLGVPASQAIFVGHKASELDGARHVGMHTVAFNRDEGASGDVVIEHFADLLSLPMLAAPAEPERL